MIDKLTNAGLGVDVVRTGLLLPRLEGSGLDVADAQKMCLEIHDKARGVWLAGWKAVGDSGISKEEILDILNGNDKNLRPVRFLGSVSGDGEVDSRLSYRPVLRDGRLVGGRFEMVAPVVIGDMTRRVTLGYYYPEGAGSVPSGYPELYQDGYHEYLSYTTDTWLNKGRLRRLHTEDGRLFLPGGGLRVVAEAGFSSFRLRAGHDHSQELIRDGERSHAGSILDPRFLMDGLAESIGRAKFS